MIPVRQPTVRRAITHVLRKYSTAADEPCTRYLAVTHPDGANSPADSPLAKKIARFGETTLGTYARPPVIFTHGKGLDLYARAIDSEGKEISRRYLDFTAGIAVNSLGHADDAIARLAGEQASTLVHASNLYYNEWSGHLAEQLATLTREHGGVGYAAGSTAAPGEDLRVFLCNSGTEANEAALKFARKVGTLRSGGPDRKTALVSFRNAFHGRTMGALSVTPNPKYTIPFAPLVGNTRVGDLNDNGAYDLIDEQTAGVIVEPIQGEGGIHPADTEWLAGLRKRCDQVGAVLIYDEIQCGLFRTGTLWSHSKLDVAAHPHVVTAAKPLANGFPIGAVVLSPEVARAVVVGDHGTTFGGNPLASRIASHVLERLSSPELKDNMRAASALLFARLERITRMFEDLIVGPPRGRGLLAGISMREPSNAGRVVALARERGVLILSAGADTLRFTPSLTVSAKEVNEAMDVLESSLTVLRG
ncbi:acetylornithine transaminase [Malassezia cuniculi]|uniref:Acetylornithine transaminase n=1 Tax=Malassezia cuniculi TaxID=948313 RepID=A0AAF0EVD4_9BASI|nr:acetylornithine transaminase [Malassezia cuniculi]